MRRVISFSAIVQTPEGIYGNCFIHYHYEKVFSDQWNICYVSSALYLKSDDRYLNAEIWNESLSKYWTTIIEGKRLVVETLKRIYPSCKEFYFIVKDEKYISEEGDKQLHILKDFVNNVQFIQLLQNYSLVLESKEDINITFYELEQKYLT